MGRELLDTTLLGDLNFVTPQRLLLFSSLHGTSGFWLLVEVELVLVVGAQVGDERVEVVEFALVLGEAQLFLVELHRWVNLRDFAKKLGNLILLSLELAILLVQVEDDPNGVLIELVRVLMLSVMRDHWHIIELAAEHLKHFDDLRFGIFLAKQHRVVKLGIDPVVLMVNPQTGVSRESIENPLGLHDDFIVVWLHTILQTHLKTLTDVLFLDKFVESGGKGIIDLVSIEDSLKWHIFVTLECRTTVIDLRQFKLLIVITENLMRLTQLVSVLIVVMMKVDTSTSPFLGSCIDLHRSLLLLTHFNLLFDKRLVIIFRL